MLQIGQDVVLMSAPGRFRIVAIDGLCLTIENDTGLRRKVVAAAVRVLPPRAPVGPS